MNLFNYLANSTRIRRSWTGLFQKLSETPRTVLIPVGLMSDILDRQAGEGKTLLLDPWFSMVVPSWPEDVEKEPWQYGDRFYYVCNRYPDVVGGYRIDQRFTIEQEDFLPFADLVPAPPTDSF